MGKNSAFEQAVEREIGESLQTIRMMTIDGRRRMIEKKRGKRMQFPSFFPFIGRGNVLRKRTMTHEEVESSLDEVLR